VQVYWPGGAVQLQAGAEVAAHVLADVDRGAPDAPAQSKDWATLTVHSTFLPAKLGAVSDQHGNGWH
jgi:hypothetical protein